MASDLVSFLYAAVLTISTLSVYTKGVKSVVVRAARHSAPIDPQRPMLRAVAVGPRLRFHPDGPVCVLFDVLANYFRGMDQLKRLTLK